MDWQPIDTAPEVGPFLVWGGTWRGEGNGPEPLGVPCVVAPCGARYDVMGTDAHAAWVLNPTHWMPLPKAPDA